MFRNSAALAGNGYVYVLPYNAPQVLKFSPTDPSDRAMVGDFTNFPGQTDKQSSMGCQITMGKVLEQQYNGAVLGLNGKIYGIPSDAERVLELDPADDSVKQIGDTYSSYSYQQISIQGDVSSSSATGNKWAGGVLDSSTGYIYAIPSKIQRVLKIDPSTGTTALIGNHIICAQGQNCGSGDAFNGGILVGNFIYALPHGTAQYHVLKYDISTNTHSELGPELSRRRSTWNKGWSGASIGRDGNIYGVPEDREDFILQVKPQTDTVSLVGPLLRPPHRYDSRQVGHNYGYEWLAAAASPQGVIYGVPSMAKVVLKIDPHESFSDSFEATAAPAHNYTVKAVAYSTARTIYAESDSQHTWSLIDAPYCTTSDITTSAVFTVQQKVNCSSINSGGACESTGLNDTMKINDCHFSEALGCRSCSAYLSNQSCANKGCAWLASGTCSSCVHATQTSCTGLCFWNDDSLQCQAVSCAEQVLKQDCSERAYLGCAWEDGQCGDCWKADKQVDGTVCTQSRCAFSSTHTQKCSTCDLQETEPQCLGDQTWTSGVGPNPCQWTQGACSTVSDPLSTDAVLLLRSQIRAACNSNAQSGTINVSALNSSELLVGWPGPIEIPAACNITVQSADGAEISGQNYTSLFQLLTLFRQLHTGRFPQSGEKHPAPRSARSLSDL